MANFTMTCMAGLIDPDQIPTAWLRSPGDHTLHVFCKASPATTHIAQAFLLLRHSDLPAGCVIVSPDTAVPVKSMERRGDDGLSYVWDAVLLRDKNISPYTLVIQSKLYAEDRPPHRRIRVDFGEREHYGPPLSRLRLLMVGEYP